MSPRSLRLRLARLWRSSVRVARAAAHHYREVLIAHDVVQVSVGRADK